jgi:hypothetical protein
MHLFADWEPNRSSKDRHDGGVVPPLYATDRKPAQMKRTSFRRSFRAETGLLPIPGHEGSSLSFPPHPCEGRHLPVNGWCYLPVCLHRWKGLSTQEGPKRCRNISISNNSFGGTAENQAICVWTTAHNQSLGYAQVGLKRMH